MKHLVAPQRHNDRRRRVRTVDDGISRIIRVVERTGWPQRIDTYRASRPGPTSALTTLPLLVAIALNAHRGAAYQHERILGVLQRLDLPVQQRLGLPLRPADADETAETGRTHMLNLTLDQVRIRFHRTWETILTLDGPDGLHNFVTDLLWAAIPRRHRHHRHLTIDGTNIPMWAAKRPTDELDADPNADWSYYIREYNRKASSNGKKRRNIPRIVLGYSALIAALFDPTDDLTTPYLVSIVIATGSAGEGGTAAQLIDNVTRHIPILDTVTVDRGMGNSPQFHDAVNTHHGHVITELGEHQQNATGQHPPTGATYWMGRIVPGDVNLAPFHADLDGQPFFPTTHPQGRGAPADQWLERLDQWFAQFDRIDHWAYKPLAHPTIDGTIRIKLDHPDNVRLAHQPEQRTATTRISDHPMRTWQPFPYGTRAWMHIYSAARSRSEGVMGDLRHNVKLTGGRHDVRIRGIQPITFLAGILGMTRNLQLSHDLAPPSGRTHTRESRRVYRAVGEHYNAMVRTLKRRREDRDQLQPNLTQQHEARPTNGPPQLP